MRSDRLSRRQLLHGAAVATGGFALFASGVPARAFAQTYGTPTATGDTLTLYNGQHVTTTQAIGAAFAKATGSQVRLRSGEDPEIAAQIVAEGDASPADVVFTENSPALMLLSEKGMLAKVAVQTLKRVPARYNSPQSDWIGVAARATVLIYNPSLLPETALPHSLLDLAQPAWRGKIGIAPAEADFQPVVVAVIKLSGEDAAKAWLAGLARNARTYHSYEAILQAVETGEVATGILNHYYWFHQAAEVGPANMRSKLFYFGHGDPGALVNISGAAVLKSSQHADLAQRFLAYLVSAEGQQALVQSKDFEYPLGSGVPPSPELKPFDQLDPPPIGPADLGDGRAAVQLLQDAGLL